MHLCLVPYIPSAGELKTKPTQHSVKELLAVGIQPDILLCRSDRPIPEGARKKIALFCNVRERARDPGARRRYDLRRAERLSRRRLRPRGVRAISASRPRRSPTSTRWRDIVQRIRKPEGEVTIAVVGKYTHLLDSYKSLPRRLAHGGIANNVHVKLDWLDCEIFEQPDAVQQLEGVRRHPRAGRLRRARRRGQDRGGALRARAQRAVFRHLLRHADGGDRGGAASRRPEGRGLDRVRPVRRSGGRADDGMDARQRARAAQSRRRSRRHDAARRLRGGAGEGSRVAEIYGGDAGSASATATATRSTSTTRSGSSARACAFPACRPTASCPRSSRFPTIPGSSACSSIPS